MGVFWALPDFGGRQPSGDFEIYAPYEPGSYLLLPTALDVGTTGDRPDLQLILVRASGSGTDYGALDLGIARRQDIPGALAFLRTIDSSATIAAAPFASGFIRVVTGPQIDSPPPDLTRPTPIGWGGVDATRWDIQLSADSAEIIKAGLTSALPLGVRAEIEVLGVLPRVGCTAVFDPAALLGALRSATASGPIPRPALDEMFLASPADLSWLKLEGDQAPDRQAFAEAMGGRVRMQFCRFVPSPASEGPCTVELPHDPPAGIMRWNLAEPYAAARSWVFTLDPFAAARELAKTAGIGALYREVTTAPIAFGFFNVDVQAFLPAPRLGILDVGVAIQVPANPPVQPQADSHTIVFQPPDDHAVVQLRLPPLARLTYVYRTYADLLEGAGTRRVDAAPVQETTATLRLQARDLPIDLIVLSADPTLLAIATLSGTMDYTAPNGAAVSTAFSLTADRPRVAVALPRDASSASMSVDALASPADSQRSLRLGPLPASARHFTLGSFPEYGAHAVAITCTFPPGASGPFGIDLIADGQSDTAGAATTLFLTKDSPTAEWSYTADSPFRAGYRWRAHPDGPWSNPLAPGTPLRLTAPAGPAATPQVWDLDGVHVYVAPGEPPGRVRYVPGDPTPQLDEGGRPTLMLVDTGATAVLSLGTCLALSDAQRNDLEVALLERLSGVQRIDFEPAPFSAGAVTLALVDASGAFQPIATTASTGTLPYNATFSVQLRADQRARAIAAVNGTVGQLRVQYTLTLPPDVAETFDSTPTTLVRTVDVAAWFPGGSGAAHIAQVSA